MGQWLILVCLAKCLQDVCLGYLFPPLSSLPSFSPAPCHKPLSWGEETHHHLGTFSLPELTGNPLLLTAATFGHVSLSLPRLPLSFSFKMWMFKLECPIPALRFVCIVTHRCQQSWLAYHSVRREEIPCIINIIFLPVEVVLLHHFSFLLHSLPSCLQICKHWSFTNLVVHFNIPPTSATKHLDVH